MGQQFSYMISNRSDVVIYWVSDISFMALHLKVKKLISNKYMDLICLILEMVNFKSN